MKLITISDTHMAEPDLPEGDILIHSGDMTFRGTFQEVSKQLYWLGKQAKKYKHTIVVFGNHDFLLEKEPGLARRLCEDNGLILLNEQEIVIEGIKFFGSPITPYFHNWAFNRHPEDISIHWDIIPDDTNVLITHGPPFGILDGVPEHESTLIGYDKHYRPMYAKKLTGLRNCGCPALLERIKELKQLKLHVFGHIHEAYGQETHFNIQFINPAIMDGDYKPVNKPIIAEIK